MTEKELAAQLKREGFSHTYIWEDEPYKRYPDHKHPLQTANVILNGEVTITVEGSQTPTGRAIAATFPRTPSIPP
jgi:hypothetical protein